jgi:cell division transport system permease protein
VTNGRAPTTLNPRNIEFLIQEALVGVRRNGLMAIASISTIALSIAILATFCLLILGAHGFAQRELRKFEVAVFLKPGVETSVVESTAAKVREMPFVTNVEIYSKEKAWPEFKRSFPHITAAGLKNPLPDKLRVSVRDPKKTSKVADAIRKFPNIDKVDEGRTQLKYVLAVADFIKWFGAAASLALLAATIFIISNAIRLTVFVRRREIKIMQMVGATNWFIRVPLILEGVIFGATGAAIAFLLVAAGMTYVTSVITGMMPMMQGVSSGVDKGQIFATLMIGGIIIGAAGSFISIRRFLKN